MEDDDDGMLLATEGSLDGEPGGEEIPGMRAPERAPTEEGGAAAPGAVKAETSDAGDILMAARGRLMSSLVEEPRPGSENGSGAGTSAGAGGAGVPWLSMGAWSVEGGALGGFPLGLGDGSMEAIVVTINDRKVVINPNDDQAPLYQVLRQWMDDDSGGQPWRLLPPKGPMPRRPPPDPPAEDEDEDEDEAPSTSGVEGESAAGGGAGGGDSGNSTRTKYLEELKVTMKASKARQNRRHRRHVARYEKRLEQLLPQHVVIPVGLQGAEGGGGGARGGSSDGSGSTEADQSLGGTAMVPKEEP